MSGTELERYQADDWDIIVAEVYTAVVASIDPASTEFGPLDNLRRSAVERAQSAAKQTRSGLGRFVEMGKEFTESGKEVRARLGQGLGSLMRKSLDPDTLKKILNNDSMPSKIMRGIITFLHDFFYKPDPPPRRSRSRSGGGGGSRPRAPKKDPLDDLDPEVKERVKEIEKVVNDQGSPTDAFTRTDSHEEDDKGLVKPLDDGTIPGRTFEDANGNKIVQDDGAIGSNEPRQWTAYDKDGNEVGKFDSAADAELGVDEQAAIARYDAVFEKFLADYGDEPHPAIANIVAILKDRKKTPYWKVGKAAAEMAKIGTEADWSSGQPVDGDGKPLEQKVGAFEGAATNLYNLYRIKKAEREKQLKLRDEKAEEARKRAEAGESTPAEGTTPASKPAATPAAKPAEAKTPEEKAEEEAEVKRKKALANRKAATASEPKGGMHHVDDPPTDFDPAASAPPEGLNYRNIPGMVMAEGAGPMEQQVRKEIVSAASGINQAMADRKALEEKVQRQKQVLKEFDGANPAPQRGDFPDGAAGDKQFEKARTKHQYQRDSLPQPDDPRTVAKLGELRTKEQTQRKVFDMSMDVLANITEHEGPKWWKGKT